MRRYTLAIRHGGVSLVHLREQEPTYIRVVSIHGEMEGV
jgi:hypothetical protein